jgi:hypothetical protein
MTDNNSDKPLGYKTKEKYTSNIRSYFKRTKTKDLLPQLNNPQVIVNNIDKFTDMVVSSRVDILQSILKLLNMGIIPKSIYIDSNYEILNNHYRILKKESDEGRSIKRTTDDNSVFHIDDLKRLILDKYGAGSKENIILGLYVECAKRDDFNITLTPTIPTDKSINFLIVPAKGNLKVLIHVHKTADRYEAETDSLSAGLSKEIRDYIKKNKIQMGSQLFREKKLTCLKTRVFLT